MRLNSIVPVSAIVDDAGGVDCDPLINVTSPRLPCCRPMGGGNKRDTRTSDVVVELPSALATVALCVGAIGNTGLGRSRMGLVACRSWVNACCSRCARLTCCSWVTACGSRSAKSSTSGTLASRLEVRDRVGVP